MRWWSFSCQSTVRNYFTFTSIIRVALQINYVREIYDGFKFILTVTVNQLRNTKLENYCLFLLIRGLISIFLSREESECEALLSS